MEDIFTHTVPEPSLYHNFKAGTEVRKLYGCPDRPGTSVWSDGNVNQYVEDSTLAKKELK